MTNQKKKLPTKVDKCFTKKSKHTARECIFTASGGTRFKNFCQPWCQKERGGTPRCNLSAQKNSGYVTGNQAFLMSHKNRMITEHNILTIRFTKPI